VILGLEIGFIGSFICNEPSITAGGEDGSAALAEAYAGMAGEFTGASEDDLVAVSEVDAGFSGGKLDGMCSVAGEFEEAAGGGFSGPGDGSGGEDIADLEVTAVARVMGNELGRGPVEVAGVALA
jgi:hypothetical protein